MASNPKIPIEVLTDRVISMRTALDQHILDDKETKEHLFAYLEKIDSKADDRDEKRDKQNEDMKKTVNTLWDIKTRQEGAFGMGKWVAGGVGGLVVAIVTWLAK